MEKEQILISILLVSLLLIFLVGFVFLILFIQRKKTNRFITERENMKRLFNEQLLRSQLEMQEQTFNAISMEIHDNVGQTLSLLKMQLNIMGQQNEIHDPILNDAKLNAGKAMADLRDIARSLNTDRISATPLSELIADELKRITGTGSVNGCFNMSGTESEMISEKKLIIFRIIQECLQNIIKHAEAGEITIQMNYLNGRLTLLVIDNGKGFSQDNYKLNSGLGMKNIYKRAEILGGIADINSVADKGTTVKIDIPYE